MYYTGSIIKADLIEKDIIKVDFVEKEIISAKFTTIDILNYLEVVGNLRHEVLTRLSSTMFKTSEPYVSGSIQVFINGLKVRNVDLTEIDDQTIQIVDNTISSDIIEGSYIKKS